MRLKEMSFSSRCWAVDLPLIPLSAMTVLLNRYISCLILLFDCAVKINICFIKSESCSDMIFDLALGFFFMVSYQ